MLPIDFDIGAKFKTKKKNSEAKKKELSLSLTHKILKASFSFIL
jgi:hypothetical protein